MQPDFSKLFLRTTVAPLHFRVRSGPCYVHDVEFLSSYLHDARLSPAAIKKRGKRVPITFERDCWELGYTKHARSVELHIARSRLSITPVATIRSEVSDPRVLKREIWIERIYVGPAHWERSDVGELVITAPHSGWRLCICIEDHYGDIRLDDLERPYLYSARKSCPSAALAPESRSKGT